MALCDFSFSNQHIWHSCVCVRPSGSLANGIAHGTLRRGSSDALVVQGGVRLSRCLPQVSGEVPCGWAGEGKRA